MQSLIYTLALQTWGGGSEKLKERGGTMVQGMVFSKRGASTFPTKFFLGLSFLHLQITSPFAKLHHPFEEKIFFLPP